MVKGSATSAPKLKIKAAESRYLLPCIRIILERYMKLTTPHEILRHRCVVLLDDMYTAMRKPAGEFDGAEVGRLGRKHLILYSELWKEALELKNWHVTGWVAWRWYPNHHRFSHFGTQVAESGSPCESWCYKDESFIGDCVDIAETCHPRTLHRSVVHRLRI